MTYLLDTNVVSEARRPRQDKNVLNWLAAQPLTSTYLCVITLGELEEGIATLGDTQRAQALRGWLAQLTESFGGRILDVDRNVATTWGRIRAEAKRQGRPPTRRRRPARGHSHQPRADARHPQRRGRRHAPGDGPQPLGRKLGFEVRVHVTALGSGGGSGLPLEPPPQPPAHVVTPEHLLDGSPRQQFVLLGVRLRSVDAQGTVVFPLDPNVQTIGSASVDGFVAFGCPHPSRLWEADKGLSSANRYRQR